MVQESEFLIETEICTNEGVEGVEERKDNYVTWCKHFLIGTYKLPMRYGSTIVGDVRVIEEMIGEFTWQPVLITTMTYERQRFVLPLGS